MKNDDTPLVTVVTVNYNTSALIRDAIESVLAQTYPNIEYVIGDNCSTDDSWAIINSYTDPRIVRYRNDRNLGEYPNRNRALAMARGEYLLFVDSDDIIYPNGVAFFVEMIQAFPNAGMAIQKGYFNNMLFPALLYPGEVLSNHYLGDDRLLQSSFLSNFFRTSILREAGPLETRYVSGDNDIRVKIAARHPTLFVAGWVGWPRETPGQAHSRITEDIYINELNSYTNALLKNGTSGLEPDLVADIVGTVRRRTARYALRRVAKGKFRKALAAMENAGMKWADLFASFNFTPRNEDALRQFSPSKPFRRGFRGNNGGSA